MAEKLPDAARQWFDGANFATIGTVEPDGRPQLTYVWVKRDGDDVLVSTTRGRRKEHNLTRDPRASVIVMNPDNAYSYVEVRGRATLTEEGGPELIQELSHKYTGGPYTYDPPDAVRVVVRITPEKVVLHE